MTRFFVTGSSDDVGRMAARLLIAQEHTIVLHARDPARGRDAMKAVSGAGTVLRAEQANARGTSDAVIHNAAIGYRENWRILTEDGLYHVFTSSELHRREAPSLRDLN